MAKGVETNVERPRPFQRLSALIADNWVFVALLIGGTTLRVIVTFAYRPALMLSDAFAYVQRSVTMDPTESFHPFLYSVILKPFVVMGDLSGVPMLQHVAGLAMAVLLYALLRRLDVRPWLAALGCVPVLFDGYQLLFEHSVLSETFFQLFTVGALVLLVWSRRPHPAGVAAGGLLIGVSVLVRFTGLAVIVAALVYALLCRYGWLRIGTLIVSFLVPLAAYSFWFSSHSGSVAITNRNGFFLYGRVVAFSDCEEVSVPDDLRIFCPRGRDFEPRTKGLFTSGLPDAVRRNPSYNADALDFSKRMIAAKPLAYLSAITSDFFTFFGPNSPEERDETDKKWRFKQSLDDLRITRYVREHNEAPPPGSGIGLVFQVNDSLASFMHGYQGVVWTHGPLIGFILLIGLAGGIAGFRTQRPRWLAPEAWFLTLGCFGLLLFPTVFAVYHFRYVVPAIPLLGAAGAIGTAALIDWLRPRSASSAESQDKDGLPSGRGEDL